jgi:succinate dehydrogenase / fumarate reductase cytochrome b subunit
MASYPLVRPLEIVLFAGFLFHMILGVWLWWVNRRVRQTGYAVNRASDTSDLSSRIMWITGLVVLVFLSIHVYTFFWRSRFMDTGLTMYEMVQQAFSDPWYVAFYLVALVFLGYHLKHGFQSAFQTFGLRTSRYRRLIEWTAVLFWLVIPLAFAAMPVYFLWAYLNGVN